MAKQHAFEAEVQQLLDIVINSLYTDKEIFVRELVSNASDALEKMRLTQLTEKEIADPDRPLEIRISVDEEAKTVTIEDGGIGMTKEELVENLGTIARSGSKAFAAALQEQGKGGDAQVIGQFGVGFYSAFMVADKVEVHTRSWQPDAIGQLWTSDGKSGYEIEDAPDTPRGTRIVLHLTEDHEEFAQPYRVRGLIERYSSFVPSPILMPKPEAPKGEDDEKEKDEEDKDRTDSDPDPEWERLNTVEALWLKSKSDISDEDYTEFYKFQAHAFDDPRYRLHFSADAPIAINALLFVPERNPEMPGMGEIDPGVALYSKNVLIDPKPEGLLPKWMRFVKGVIDSEDIDLNISRESMQDSALVRKIGEVMTKRFLKFLNEEADKRPDEYAKFYGDFSRFLKEGIAMDFSRREELGKLLRYESSSTEAGKTTSIQDYVSRADEAQEKIYYQIAPNREAIENGPYLEAFKARGIEVLFMFDPIDEYVAGNSLELEGKQFVSVDSADIDLGEIDPELAGAEGEPLAEDDARELCDWLKESLDDKVSEVKISSRLVNSPAAALNATGAMPPGMKQMMKAMNQAMPEEAKPELEINPRHDLIKKLAGAREDNSEVATKVARQIADNALMDAGLLDDPKDMVARVYDLMGRALD